MALERCTRCGAWKDEEEFPWRWKALGRRHSACKACYKPLKDEWYKKNKVKHVQTVTRRKSAQREAARQYVWGYLQTHPCVECGEADPLVLEFDHVRRNKKAEISRLVADGLSIKTLPVEFLHKKQRF